MAKAKELASNFLQKAQTSSTAQMPPARAPINPFNALFAVQELSDQEDRAIDRILHEGYVPGLFTPETVESDAIEVKRLTKELKAIKKQELVLIGERIYRAREVFKKYKDRTFTDWMKLTFGETAYKSGYNYLSFFDLYNDLPDDLRSKLKEMPAKAAYVLASKDAPIERKSEIVEKYASEKAQDLITIIQETLGTDKPRKSNRKPANDRILDSMEKEAAILNRRKDQLDEGHKQKIKYLITYLKNILTS